MPKDHFDKLAYLPDPVPGQEGHYRSFEDLYGTSTTEEHRPSLIIIIHYYYTRFLAIKVVLAQIQNYFKLNSGEQTSYCSVS